MIVILGKTASGKTTIVNKLVNEYGYKQIVTYTTRPMRQGEIQDKTYHYISNDEFSKKIEEGFFAEYTLYHTVFGDWYCGTPLDDLQNAEKNSVVIVTPGGYRDIIESIGYKPFSFYIDSDEATIRFRLAKRGDNYKEIERRIAHDNKDFKGVEYLADRIIMNYSERNINDIAKKIINEVG